MEKVIFHIDQNCYFASVEMLSHPEYREVPMAVAGDVAKRHGIILAKNRHASRFGVKTAEPIWQAVSKCPDLAIVQPHYDKYAYFSDKLRMLYEEYSDMVEPFGLDECWVDMTLSCKDISPEELADEIRRRVREEFGLTCSVGVSFNKIFAKLGSDYKKPDATTIITRENYRDIVWPLDVCDLLFVGRKTGDYLHQVNIKTIGDLANADPAFIEDYLGKSGPSLWRYANGLDDDEVRKTDYIRDVKSIGNSTTTPLDMSSIDQIKGVLKRIASKVAFRLRSNRLCASCIQITIRDSELNIRDHQRGLLTPTDDENAIYETACYLFETSYNWERNVRSIGIRCTRLAPADEGIQMSLFEESEEISRRESLTKTIDDINNRFGRGSLKSCRELMGEIHEEI